ncbi:toll/interleukin-1 receptor domain-containing protein [Streptomyces sp. NBC_00620]|uniref:toll/interleukin-1 receptor domain-containing protein n=1 Tax=Streptomyces sp. NBC_00620 TaxID=2903666 RepID=UPI0022523C75|nr:toll/interleukin-1 receptor domain-containing protein [Streptomyces sp. NBC_00620]MCX4972985.1 toll/interleukin-1 receptor domain-containing protein [Streptomyces sp. NBC_00620]
MTNATDSWEYDAFISYARFDEQTRGFLTAFTTVLCETFHSLTGRPLRIFIDTVQIPVSSLWETQILHALQRSATFIAIQSPSYTTSTWCAREWDTFLTLEKERRFEYELLPYESLVFPVRYISTGLVSAPGPDAARRIKEAQTRQCVDLTGIEPHDPHFAARITALGRDLVTMLENLAPGQRPRAQDKENGESSLRFGASPEAEVPLVTTHRGPDQRRFVEHLIEARSVTVITVSDDALPDLIEEAAFRKARTAEGFWDHLHVVFPDNSVLPFINDGLSASFPDRNAALVERKYRVWQVRRRLMSLLLRYGRLGHWAISLYPFAPPFIGALFSMPDGRQSVQLSISRPKLESAENLQVNFVDRVDHYFEQAFREVVESSREEHEIVLVGEPSPSTREFRCSGARFRRSVLVDGQESGDWLAALVAITWRRGRSGVEPLLQINTPRTSTREMGKISHVSGYINQRDCATPESVAETPSDNSVFLVSEVAARTALDRELLQDFGISECANRAELVDALNFYYPDKENLFFYLFEQQLPNEARYTAESQMLPWRMDDLVTIREHQVYSNVLSVCRNESLESTQRDAVVHVLCLNLRLHGRHDAAESLAREMSGPRVSDELLARFSAAQEQTKRSRRSAQKTIYITGIAGLQYRAFFTHLVPTYERIGIPGAHDLLSAIHADASRGNALAELAETYDNREFMESLPLEV